MKRFFKVLLSLVVVFALTPATIVKAVPPPTETETTMAEEELANHNLSLGTIYWDDDLVSGQIVVTDAGNGKYNVKSQEFWRISDITNTKKGLARVAAQMAFKPIRAYAQTKGWWDCKWKVKSCSKTKVTATAKVEYKAVKMSESSKAITIKQTSTLKGGKWKTSYTVNGKKMSAAAVKKLFG